MKKFFKLFVSVIVLVLCIMFCNTVKADGDYSSIYLYSNNPENYNACQEYIRNLALDSNISSNNIHMMVEPYYIFEDTIWQKYCANELNYSNALVIFDMSAGLMEDHNPNSDPDLYFTCKLKAIFSSLKEEDCKIMFICGTQEIRFSTPGELNNSQGNLNEFLDYVDIHVNVETFDTFYMSKIVEIEKETNGSFVTLIFDENTQLYDKVIDYYQIKYANNYLPVAAQYCSFEEYLYDVYYLQIIRYNDVDGTFIHYNGFISDDVIFQIQNDVVYAIGMINNEYNFAEWIYKINFAKANISSTTWSVFVYDQLGVNISAYNILGTLNYVCRYKYSRYMVEMNNVIFDFINGEDLTPYDNYEGRCQITYSLISDNGDGENWLSYFEYAEDEDVEGYNFGYICIYG